MEGVLFIRNRFVPLLTFLMLLAPVLFLFGGILPFVTVDDEGVIGSRLIGEDWSLFSTPFDTVTMIVVLGFLGSLFFVLGSARQKLLGKMFYGLGFLFALSTIIIQFDAYSDELDGAYEPAVGLILGVSSVIVWGLITIFIILFDLFQHIMSEYYEVPGRASAEQGVHRSVAACIKDLRKWYSLTEDSTISEEDYEWMKEERLEQLNLKGISSVEAIMQLKNAMEEGLINKDDFESLKEDILENATS